MASSKMKWRNWSTEKIIGTQFEAFVYNLFIKQSRMVDWNINYYSKNKIAPVDLVEKKSLTDMVLDNLLPFNLQKGNIYSATDSEEKFGNKNLLLYELKYSSSKKIDINKRGNPVNQLLGYCRITGFKPGGIITNTNYSNKLISYANKKNVKLYSGQDLIKLDSERRSLDGFGLVDPIKWFFSEERMYSFLDKKIRSINLDQYDLSKTRVYLN